MDDPRYRCCCCHVRTCTIVIAVLEMLQYIGYVTKAFVEPNWPEFKYSTVAAVVLCVLVTVLLFVGIFMEKGKFLIPWLIFQILGIIYNIAMIIVIAIYGFAYALGYLTFHIGKEVIIGIWKGNSTDAPDLTNTTTTINPILTTTMATGLPRSLDMVLTCTAFVIGVIIHIAFFIVALKCKRYLDEKSGGGYGGGLVQMVPTNTPGVYKP